MLTALGSSSEAWPFYVRVGRGCLLLCCGAAPMSETTGKGVVETWATRDLGVARLVGAGLVKGT